VAIPPDIDQSIEELCLSVRSHNALTKSNILTIRDLIQLTASDLGKRLGVSRRCFAEITESLSMIGLSVGMTTDANGNLLHPVDPSRTEYPKPDSVDPSRYRELYLNHGYSFLPQSLMDDFYRVVSGELEKRISFHRCNIDRLRENHSSKPSEPNELIGHYETWKNVVYEEARIDEANTLLDLTNELMFLSLYRFIEIERLRILAKHFSVSPSGRSPSYARLLLEFSWIKNLYGSQAIDEIRLINNCIKHSGRVNRELAKCHSTWTESEQLSGLRDAYERLAPYVGAYWVDLVETCGKKGRGGS
jgi:hypothetical protein